MALSGWVPALAGLAFGASAGRPLALGWVPFAAAAGWWAYAVAVVLVAFDLVMAASCAPIRGSGRERARERLGPSLPGRGDG